MEPDFSGYATKNDLECSDGRTIIADAFKHQDTHTVPLVWQHQHNEPTNILGHAILENRPDGVYTYGFFNESTNAQVAKESVKHGDITKLSIFANQLIHRGLDVLKGSIREVSLVLAGANPGASIDKVYMAHGEGFEASDDEAIIHTGLDFDHESNTGEQMSAKTAEKSNQEILDSLTEEQQSFFHSMVEEAIQHGADAAAEGGDGAAPKGGKTVKDVFDGLSEEEQNVVYFMIGEAVDNATKGDGAGDAAKHSDHSDSLQHNQEGSLVTRNVFDQNGKAASASKATLTHDAMEVIMTTAERNGSLKEALLMHAGTYGIDNIELLFPDAKALSSTPELIARQADWVPKVLSATKNAPFAKIKSIVADLTAPEARAKGYIKGNEKIEEVIPLLRRTTGPTTVYKKQKLDRDDLIDITDFDVVAWLKWEIRFMLNEELARAILIGDGRSAISSDKIKDPAGSTDGTGIRSIVNDNDLYSHKVDLPANSDARALVRSVSTSRMHYRGSGTPSWYTTDKIVTDMLHIEDTTGRRLYGTEAELAAALRVKEIVTVEVLEETPELVGIMVNLVDYTVGANKGGELSFFEDFDLDFNQQKYLLETRVSGALTKPKAAVVIRRAQGELATVKAPSFNGSTNTITVPTATGVIYMINGVVVTGATPITEDAEIVASAAEGYYIPAGTVVNWTFTYTGA